jgi:hypothetical protein
MSYLDKIKQWEAQGEKGPASPTRILRDELNELNEKSSYQPTTESETVLSRLRAGTEWLTAQHQAWFVDRPNAESDERFSTALEGWDLLERKLRQEFGYEGCIHGPGQRCPEDVPVVCDFCAGGNSMHCSHCGAPAPSATPSSTRWPVALLDRIEWLCSAECAYLAYPWKLTGQPPRPVQLRRYTSSPEVFGVALEHLMERDK